MTKPLPLFTSYRPRKGPLAQFVYDYEPEGKREADRFRRQLARILSTAPKGDKWIAGTTR